MKIGIVCPASLPATQFGGILFLGVDLARELSNEKHQVTIYTTDLDFANKKSIEFIDKILENEKQAVIIIQGDHGSAFGINLQDPTDDDVVQKLSNFNAIYFPDEKHRKILVDDPTNVNTFRVVFNSHFGSDYEILEDKIYWGLHYKKPFWFKDVTSMLLN